MSATLGFVATLAEMEQFYRGDKAGQIIELMNKTNDIMDDVPWMEANQSDGHLTRIRTGLPAVYWRRLYQGTPPSGARSRKAAASLRPLWNWMWKRSACTATATAPSA